MNLALVQVDSAREASLQLLELGRRLKARFEENRKDRDFQALLEEFYRRPWIHQNLQQMTHVSRARPEADFAGLVFAHCVVTENC